MYTEIIHDSAHYFVQSDILKNHTINLATDLGRRHLMQFSDFVVVDNEIVKSRAMVAEMVRGYCRLRSGTL